MKTNQTKLGVVLGSFLAVVLTASTASAAAGVAAGVAGAAGGALNRPELPPAAIERAPMPPIHDAAEAATARASAGANAAAAAAERSRTPEVPSPGLNVNATTHASAEGSTHGLAIAAAASGGLSASIASDETAKAIRGTKFEERAKLASDIEARLGASEKLVTRLEDDAKTADSKSHAALAKSLASVRKQQQQVRASLKAAAAASGDNWGRIQSELAKDYGDLAKVVTEAELTAKASVAAKGAPGS